MNIKKVVGILSISLVLGASLVGCGNKGVSSPPVAEPKVENAANEITEAEAKALAAENAGFKISDVEFIKIKKELDDGMVVYEIDFIKDDKKYETKLNAADGAIIQAEYEDISPGSTPVQKDNDSSQSNIISEEEAKKIVLDRIPGASESDFVKFKLDRDHNKNEYEGKVIYEEMEYEFEIDAETGIVTDWDEESIHD